MLRIHDMQLSEGSGSKVILVTYLEIGWGTPGPPKSGPRHLDPRYYTVYKTFETGVEMSNFRNKVGHLD